MSPRKRSQPPAERSKLKNVALFTLEKEEAVDHTLTLNQITLSPTQPRRYFDPQAMQSLVESVKSEGILQPLLVRPVGNKYEVVAGERRYRAAQDAGLTEVPVVKREMSDEQAVQYSLIENLQRVDLNPVEETEGILQLLALKLKADLQGVITLLNLLSKSKRGLAHNVVRPEQQQAIEEVFQGIGRLSPESFRTHRLPLLNLPEDVLEALRSGQIEYTKASAIAKLNDETARKLLLTEAIAQSLSLSQIRERVKASTPPQQQSELQNRLRTTYKKALKSQVWSNPKKRKKLESLLAKIEELISEGGEEQSQPVNETIALANSQQPSTINSQDESRPLTLEEPTKKESQLADSEPIESLTHAEMLERLGVKTSTLSTAKKKANFAEWSKSKDPEAIAWQWVGQSKLFLPVNNA